MSRFNLLALLLFVLPLGLLAGCGRHLTTAVADMSDEAIAPADVPSDEELCRRIDHVVAFGRANRHLDGDRNAAWQIVHGLLAFGKDFEIYKDGELVPALDYLLKGGQLNGWQLRKANHGVVSILEPGSKTGMGHPDQWLGYLSQSGLSLKEPLIVGGEQFTVEDLLTQSEWDIYPGMEATWTLMAYATYLPLDAQWTSKDGTEWTIDKIVDMEADQDIDKSPCGGTHRLFGLAVALNHHLENGGKAEGAWAKADRVIQNAIAKARAYQQPDGSFSSQFFIRSEYGDDIDKRIGASGHVFEFLCLSANGEQFASPWMTQGMLCLVDMLEQTEGVELECGGLYHAMHGLELYRLRRFGPPEVPSATPDSTASR